MSNDNMFIIGIHYGSNRGIGVDAHLMKTQNLSSHSKQMHGIKSKASKFNQCTSKKLKIYVQCDICTPLYINTIKIEMVHISTLLYFLSILTD